MTPFLLGIPVYEALTVNSALGGHHPETGQSARDQGYRKILPPR
jgi:hypothetical protein